MATASLTHPWTPSRPKLSVNCTKGAVISEFSTAVLAGLDEVTNADKRLFETGRQLMTVAGGSVYVFDLLAIATLNRAVAVSSRFNELTRARNMVAAGPLVRVHLDTALRYDASHLVDDQVSFVMA